MAETSPLATRHAVQSAERYNVSQTVSEHSARLNCKQYQQKSWEFGIQDKIENGEAQSSSEAKKCKIQSQTAPRRPTTRRHQRPAFLLWYTGTCTWSQ